MTNGVVSPSRRLGSRAPDDGSASSRRSAASPARTVSPSTATTDGIAGPDSPSASASASPPGAHRAAAVHVVPRSTPSASRRSLMLPRSRRCAPGRSGPARCCAGYPLRDARSCFPALGAARRAARAPLAAARDTRSAPLAHASPLSALRAGPLGPRSLLRGIPAPRRSLMPRGYDRGPGLSPGMFPVVALSGCPVGAGTEARHGRLVVGCMVGVRDARDARLVVAGQERALLGGEGGGAGGRVGPGRRAVVLVLGLERERREVVLHQPPPLGAPAVRS